MQSMQVGPYILQVRLLTHKDKDEIIHLQQKVYDALEQPEQLQQLNKKYGDLREPHRCMVFKELHCVMCGRRRRWRERAYFLTH